MTKKKSILEIDHKIIITGIVCLTTIYTALILFNHDTDTLGTMIIGCIALAIGVVIPSPKMDNKRGVLKW